MKSLSTATSAKSGSLKLKALAVISSLASFSSFFSEGLGMEDEEGIAVRDSFFSDGLEAEDEEDDVEDEEDDRQDSTICATNDGKEADSAMASCFTEEDEADDIKDSEEEVDSAINFLFSDEDEGPNSGELEKEDFSAELEREGKESVGLLSLMIWLIRMDEQISGEGRIGENRVGVTNSFKFVVFSSISRCFSSY
jgi:hypothetical protein